MNTVDVFLGALKEGSCSKALNDTDHVNIKLLSNIYIMNYLYPDGSAFFEDDNVPVHRCHPLITRSNAS